MKETTAYALSITASVAIITLGCSHGCQQVEQTKRDAMKAGLVERILPGSRCPSWVKPE